EDIYDINYWVKYQTEDVLKRMLFFRLYQHFFVDKGQVDEGSLSIMPTPDPFIGSIQFNENSLYVYVIRGDVNDFLMYMKWKGQSFNERLIIIAEEIRHLE